MDALPMIEENDFSYKSSLTVVCMHVSQMVIQPCYLEQLNYFLYDFDGTVYFIFQPEHMEVWTYHDRGWLISTIPYGYVWVA